MMGANCTLGWSRDPGQPSGGRHGGHYCGQQWQPSQHCDTELCKVPQVPVLPLEDLIDHPLNLIGLGGMRTSPMGFVILPVQVTEITGYDEDVVFLVIPDESEFSRCVPLILGMCTLCRIVNIIKESELNRLSISWSIARTLRLLSRWGMVDLGSGQEVTQRRAW